MRTGLPRRVLWILMISVFSGALVWLIGVSLAQSVLVGAVIMALGAGRSKIEMDSGVVWPILAADRDPSVRRELSRLSMEVAGLDGRTTDHATEYLGRLTRARLERHGVRLTDRSRAESLIGPLAYSVAIETPDPPLRYYEFERCVVALEALDTTPLPGDPA